MSAVAPSPRIAFATLGCKVNQSEIDTLGRQFAAAGYACVSFEEVADVYVVNTCTVTHVADKKSRQIMKQAHRMNPDALVVATGCYASIAGAAFADEQTLVVRNRDKDHMVTLVDGRLARTSADLPYFAEVDKYTEAGNAQVRFRAVVKVQDGCDSHCTYCIIPRARGRSRSVAPLEVVRRVQALVVEGHAEVVITGVDLGSYGENDPSLPDLGGLLTMVLDRTDVPRIRVSSLEPGDFSPAWLDLWESPRLCRHLHIPLQAGSGGVLARMERRYDPAHYAEMVAICRQRVPGITITTDLIVGFPGETEAEFEEGYAFIRALEFDGIHVFKYSPRSGTRAARMPDQVLEPVKTERSRQLREEASRCVARLIDRHTRAAGVVAWEGQHQDVWKGLTDTNVRVYGARPARITGLERVRLDGAYYDGLWSEPLVAEIPLISVS